MIAPFLIRDFILDILYPPTCVGCNQAGEWLCEPCLLELPIEGNEEEIISMGKYADPTLRTLLTSFKYQSATCLLPVFTQIIRRFRSEYGSPWPWRTESHLSICAVPSDARRIRERGLDHAECLVKIVHQELVPWAGIEKLLIRTRHVQQNANLPHSELRKANIHEVFQAIGSIRGAVLLIDDVYTTGASWNEAARILKQAGATQVYGFVFARG